MLYLVTYDVPSTDNTTRDKIAHALAAVGLVRVQYSVFWGFMSRNQAESVALKVQQILGTVEGDVRVVPICKKCRTRLLHVTVAVAGGKAAIARGTATINTKFLSRAAKALLGKGAPAVPVPISPPVSSNQTAPLLGAAATTATLSGLDPSIPTLANFNIDVLTAKKPGLTQIDKSSGDAPPVDTAQIISDQLPPPQSYIISQPSGNISQPVPSTSAPPANSVKKPFLLI